MGCCNTNLVHPQVENPYENHIFKMQPPKPIQDNYYDQQFKNNSQSISDDFKRFKIGQDYEWKRELKSDLYLQDFESKNFVKGKLNDDYFIEALQDLVLVDLRGDILKRIFITKQKSERYAVYINICGEWNIVTVDNFFLYKQGQPLFSHHRLGDPWVMILEKVFAKIYGYYTKLEKSGTKYEIMKDLTGCPYILNMNKNDQVQDTMEYDIFKFDSDSYLISHSLPIVKNKNTCFIVEMDVQFESLIYLTLSQSDLKLNSNNHYAQLTLIVGRKDKSGDIYQKYDQIRDLTLKLKNIQGQYYIYAEVFWQEYTDYKLNLQSYGKKEVTFKDSKSDPKIILNQLINTHYCQNQINYIENLQYIESQIGRYYYAMFKNKAKDQIIKVNFNIQKSLISTCLPHNDFTKSLRLKPEQEELIKFQILLENKENHNFKFGKDKNVIFIKSLTDQELKNQCLQMPTKIIKGNQQMKIYEYSDDHQAGYLFQNQSDKIYSETRTVVKMKNLTCKDMNNQNIINIKVLPNEERLLRFDIIDWKIEKYELETKVNYNFE